MRCEQCGRLLKNAHMWQLGGDLNAPTSRSMRQLCWECRERAASREPERGENASSILAEAYAIVREVESRSA
jgi:preprotein translocase subunit SecA